MSSQFQQTFFSLREENKKIIHLCEDLAKFGDATVAMATNIPVHVNRFVDESDPSV
jgi:hypothetical protein